MKALTVQQPWAWAIMLGAKPIENRTQLWTHRGDLGIHAGARISERGLELVPRLMAEDGWGSIAGIRQWMLSELIRSALLGVVTLSDAHHVVEEHHGGEHVEAACCSSRWAETSYAEHGGRTRRDVVHLELVNPRPLAIPIPCKGRLGLWTPPADVLEQLHPSEEGDRG